MGTRDELHELVSSLPEEALDAARAALTQFQGGPSPQADRIAALEHFRQAQQRVHERVEERIREMLERLARRDAGNVKRR